MFKSKAGVALAVGLLSLAAHAQTIEEITALQRKKLINELTKDIGNAMPLTAPAALAPVKREPAKPVVVGIGGDPSDPKRFTVSVTEGERAAIDYRVGETTAEGWRVVRIGKRDASFSRPGEGKMLTVEYASGNPARIAPVQAPQQSPAGFAAPVPVSAATR